MITAEALRNQVKYDQETGIFTWKNPSCTHLKPGDPVAKNLRSGYLLFKVGGKTYSAHRLAFIYMTGEWPINEVDHINGIRSDNRWSNLRQATRAENMCNKKIYKNSSSLVRGVTFHKRIQKWQVRVGINGERVHVGYFETIDEAAVARQKVELALHGDFSAALSRASNAYERQRMLAEITSQIDLFAGGGALSHVESGSIPAPQLQKHKQRKL